MVDLHKQDGCIRNDIDKAIADAVDECAFIKGAEVGTFEAELAHYVNAKYCISCGNGTDAITLDAPWLCISVVQKSAPLSDQPKLPV